MRERSLLDAKPISKSWPCGCLRTTGFQLYRQHGRGWSFKQSPNSNFQLQLGSNTTDELNSQQGKSSQLKEIVIRTEFRQIQNLGKKGAQHFLVLDESSSVLRGDLRLHFRQSESVEFSTGCHRKLSDTGTVGIRYIIGQDRECFKNIFLQREHSEYLACIVMRIRRPESIALNRSPYRLRSVARHAPKGIG